MHLGQEVHYYMVYFAYFTKLDLQISDYAQNEKIYGQFCPCRKAAYFCHLASFEFNLE